MKVNVIAFRRALNSAVVSKFPVYMLADSKGLRSVFNPVIRGTPIFAVLNIPWEGQEAFAIEMHGSDGLKQVFSELKDKENKEVVDLDIVLQGQGDASSLWVPSLETGFPVKALKPESFRLPRPEEFGIYDEELEVRWTEGVDFVMFPSRKAKGFNVGFTMKKPGSVKELTTVRNAVDQAEALITNAQEENFMAKARRAQVPVVAAPPAPPAAAPAAPATPPAAAAPTPPAEAPKTPATPPAAAPAAATAAPVVTTPPAPPADPTVPAKTPAGNRKPEEGAQEGRKKRTKDEIRRDNLSAAFKLLHEEKDASDVASHLEHFAKTLLMSRGYKIEKTESKPDDIDSVLDTLKQACIVASDRVTKLGVIIKQVPVVDREAIEKEIKEQIKAKLLAGINL